MEFPVLFINFKTPQGMPGILSSTSLLHSSYDNIQGAARKLLAKSLTGKPLPSPFDRPCRDSGNDPLGRHEGEGRAADRDGR